MDQAERTPEDAVSPPVNKEGVRYESWRDAVVSWLFRQRVDTILLVFLFAINAYAAYYAANVLVPAHLKQIQAGYDKNATDLKSAVQQMVDSNEKHNREQMDLILKIVAEKKT